MAKKEYNISLDMTLVNTQNYYYSHAGRGAVSTWYNQDIDYVIKIKANNEVYIFRTRDIIRRNSNN